MRLALDSVFDLIEFGRYNEASAELTRQSTLEASLLQLLLETEIDDPDDVLERLKPIRERHLSNRERVLSLFILGRTAYMRGHAEGIALLRKAVKLAEGCNDAKLLARAQARLTRFVLHRVGVEASMPELALLRRRAHAAGDTHTVAAFHCLVAEIEMKRGRYGAAAKHLRVAESLSADTADVGMAATVNRLVANAALVASDPRTGIPAVRRAVELLEGQGARYSLMASLTTLADLDLMTGDLHEAESAAARALDLNTGRSGNLACLDTLAKVDLARSDPASAADRLAAIDALGAFKPDDYDWLWHVPTRARWLIADRRPADARVLLREHLSAATKAGDHRLLARFLLRDVEALIAHGAAGEAAKALTEAVDALPIVTLEDLIQINAIAATLSPDHEGQFLSRVSRLQEIGFLGVADSSASVPAVADAPDTVAVHESATLLTVGPNPQLVAHQIAAFLATTGCADSVTVVSQADASKSSGAQNNDIAPLVQFDADEAGRVIIAGRARRDVDSQVTLMAARLIARAAVELANSRRRDRFEPSLWPEMLSEESFGMVIAATGMKELLEITRRVAGSAATVLITGESGTGKELFARAIHEVSHRSARPFIPFNCGAVSRDMLASQLFGHRRGAFTGAHDNFSGVIRAAAGGTLFLDEVGELPLDVQPKLLRFLESGEVHPLGESRPVQVVSEWCRQPTRISNKWSRTDVFARISSIA
jgi:hypothetical protein